MRRWECDSEAATEAVGAGLAAELAPDGVLLLYGELGSGKSVLARGVASALGIPAAEVQSPTFTIIREHAGPKGRLIHVDLYRLDPEHAEALGLEEILAGSGVKIVEWAERLAFPVVGARRLRLTNGASAGSRIVEELERS